MDIVEHMVGGIAGALLVRTDRLTKDEKDRACENAVTFVKKTVHAMQAHYRIGLSLCGAACLVLAFCMRGRSFGSLEASDRLTLLQAWMLGPLPGVKQCAQFFLTLTLVSVFDSNEGLQSLAVDIPELRNIERYYAGMPQP